MKGVEIARAWDSNVDFEIRELVAEKSRCNDILTQLS